MVENKLTSNVYNLKIPLTLLKNEKLKSFPIFKGMTAGLLEISCHVLVLTKDYGQHDLHNHDEEDEMKYGMHRMVSPDIHPTMHRLHKNM